MSSVLVDKEEAEEPHYVHALLDLFVVCEHSRSFTHFEKRASLRNTKERLLLERKFRKEEVITAVPVKRENGPPVYHVVHGEHLVYLYQNLLTADEKKKLPDKIDTILYSERNQLTEIEHAHLVLQANQTVATRSRVTLTDHIALLTNSQILKDTDRTGQNGSFKTMARSVAKREAAIQQEGIEPTTTVLSTTTNRLNARTEFWEHVLFLRQWVKPAALEVIAYLEDFTVCGAWYILYIASPPTTSVLFSTDVSGVSCNRLDHKSSHYNSIPRSHRPSTVPPVVGLSH